MSFTALLTQDVVLHVRSDTAADDDHGNPVPAPTINVNRKGFVGRQFAAEQGDRGVVQVETYTLFLDPDAPVDGWDAVTVGGATYEIVGPPWPVWNPRTARVHHIEANLRRASV